MILPFFFLLREVGIPISFQYVMDFFQGYQKGLVYDLQSLFVFLRLVCIKKVEYYDLYERAFRYYFLGEKVELPHPVPVESILASPRFREWLEKILDEWKLQDPVLHDLSLEELLQKFWETYLQQKEEHHGGSRWIGVGGTSPYGHSGAARGGIRVYGGPGNRSAMKVLGPRRYIDYSGEATLGSENIRQALATLKMLKPHGPPTELDIDATIRETCRLGGEIELVFQKELQDKLEVMVFLDNGGFSMTPYVSLVRLLFTKMKSQFRNLEFYYFHNTIYSGVYKDVERTRFYSLEDMFRDKKPEIRLFIIGDANMGPYELLAPYGAISFFGYEPIPSIKWLEEIRDHFPHSVWLNPIPKSYWPYESRTIQDIGSIFFMEELTLQGLRKAVEYLQQDEIS
ncbi:MAG: hypothetical protein D6785_13910 [Planctomycetota bacterium]|nr:MAG: hypothetical protein D6785_13910 [Planctomycetota bacterium]